MLLLKMLARCVMLEWFPKLEPLRIGVVSALLFAFAAYAAETISISDVTHSPPQPQSATPVQISARIKGPVANASLEYQWVEPGKYIDLKDPAFKTNWLSVPMTRQGKVFTATLPAELQKHRRLVRYRIRAADANGQSTLAPGPNDTVRNFAYFVYDGIPAWRGAIERRSANPQRSQPALFSTNTMRRVQAYHLISKKRSVESATWRDQAWGREYRYTGTLVSDGIVYDHVRFRARGGGWRYAMGKNMWKIDFYKGHHFQAKDDWGRPYRAKWSKLNLGACIQQGDYGYRGEQGMFESAGFRLFNLAGVEAPRTHFVQLRIIDEAEENPTNQYQGDFWGLYLAVENEDGHFLKEHQLPDGNVYKMESGSGALNHHGEGASTNGSDLINFMSAYNRAQPAAWWRTNVDLPRYYSYRAIIECIHHYDVEGGKNYDYYFNPKSGLWHVIPWDIDLSWADNMYGGANEPFYPRVIGNTAYRIEYQNRLREIRDLLYNTDQAWQLINEYAALISNATGEPSLVDADRAKWDYHPAMLTSGKAGQGLFYQAAPTKNFAGMVRLMRDYVKRRGAWIDSALLDDRQAPPALTITNASRPSYPASRLSFTCSAYKGNTFAAMKWRLGEITKTNSSEAAHRDGSPYRKEPAHRDGSPYPPAPNVYEITPFWESPELAKFSNTISIPPNVAKPGHCYRARVRVKDSTGRWSHWSAPVEFVAGK